MEHERAAVGEPFALDPVHTERPRGGRGRHERRDESDQRQARHAGIVD
jgi:hypothetical protein